jgi:hypothetical protein
MFYRPNGARELHLNDRAISSGQFSQTKLLPLTQTGYSCIRVLAKGGVLLFCGGTSE